MWSYGIYEYTKIVSYTKMYPRELFHEIYTGDDEYLKYRHRKSKDGGHTTTIRTRNGKVKIDYRWFVPYSSLRPKILKVHINVEYSNFVKSIKYICNNINKGSAMAVVSFNITEASNNEMSQFKTGL